MALPFDGCRVRAAEGLMAPPLGKRNAAEALAVTQSCANTTGR